MTASSAQPSCLGAGCGVLGSTVNPFAVGAAIDSLSSTGLVINQGIIIGLGVVLWLSTLAISIVFVMRYAKKVKADKGSTIMSLQEQQVMNEEFGHDEADGDAEKAGPMTVARRQRFVVFALTFVIMIISFIPWESLGVNAFNAGATFEEVEMTVTGEEITSVYDEATETALTLNGDASGVAVAEEQVTDGWSAFLTRFAARPVVLRRGFDLVPADGPRHRRHRRPVREPLRQGVHQRRRRHDVGRADHRLGPLDHRPHGRDRARHLDPRQCGGGPLPACLR